MSYSFASKHHKGSKNMRVCVECMEWYVVLVHWLPNNPLGNPSRSWQQYACIGINNVCPDGDVNK